MAIEYTTPASTEDLQKILDLQAANLPAAVSPEQLTAEGFVTVQHTLNLLTSMNEAAPQVIAKDGDQLAGYALVMLQSFRDMVPVLRPMFDKLETLDFHGKPLNTVPFYVMGQVCVAAEYRGKGIFAGMYNKHRELYSRQFDLCVTEVATRNTRSLRAHQKVGFRSIHAFTDATDSWDIIAWDWS